MIYRGSLLLILYDSSLFIHYEKIIEEVEGILAGFSSVFLKSKSGWEIWLLVMGLWVVKILHGMGN